VNFRKHSLLLTAIEEFHSHGEMPTGIHIHKAMSFAQSMDLLEVPFAFILYKHGPYSVDIEFELDQMRSYSAVVAGKNPFLSQVLRVGSNGDLVRKKAPLQFCEVSGISRVCAFLSKRSLIQVDLFATAAWISYHERISNPEQLASRLHSLKPFISKQDAIAGGLAVSQFDQMRLAG